MSADMFIKLLEQKLADQSLNLGKDQFYDRWSKCYEKSWESITIKSTAMFYSSCATDCH